MSDDDTKEKKGDVPPLSAMSPTLDSIPVDLAAIRSRFPSVELGITIGGKYRIEKEIGRGGMGSVYRAIQLSMNRPVAVKTLRAEMLAEDVPVKRFFREAKSASQLNHPNIVRVFDFGVDEGLGAPYLVMELLEGKTLTQMVEEKPLSERHAARLMTQVCKALVDAHSHGMVHRDLKPDNILVVEHADGEEHVKVLDFGLAKVWEASSTESMVTQSGQIAGTPAFMSPEQIVGEAVDYRADLYALGCMLFYVLVGRPPFGGDEALSVVIKQVNEPAPSLLDAMKDIDLPSHDMCVMFERLMAKDAKERPKTTTSVARYFRAIARGEAPNPEQLDAEGVDLSRNFSNQPVTTPAVETGVRSRPSGVHAARKEKRDLVYLAMGPLFLIGLGVILAQGFSNEPIPEEPTTASASIIDKNAEPESSQAPGIEVVPVADSKSRPKPSGGTLSKEEAAALIGSLAADSGDVESRWVTVETKPSGATLYRGQKKLGTSPLKVDVAGSESWVLTIKHPKHATVTRQLGARTPNALTVELGKK